MYQNYGLPQQQDVYVEWPMESNHSQAMELTELVKTYNFRNVVGLQDGFTPVAKKISAIIQAGDIGRVETSTFIGKIRGGACNHGKSFGLLRG